MFSLKKNKAQVVLETVLVFIAVALLLAGSIKLFSKLNQSMLDRYKTFRDSRYQAVNSMVQGIGPEMNPKSFLEFNAEPGSGFSGPYIPNLPDQHQEERINQAEIKLREMDNILNLILPHKMYQVKDISENLIEDYCVRQCGWGGYYCCERLDFGPPGYGTELQTLCNEMINRSQVAYNNVIQARLLFQQVYDRPTQYGPYDQTTCSRDNPTACPDPRLPEYDPDDPEFLEKYQRAYDLLYESIDLNRSMLLEAIESLAEARDGLYELIYNAPVDTMQYAYPPRPSKGLLGRLRFIRDNVLKKDSSFSKYRKPHTNSIITINELMDFMGVAIGDPSDYLTPEEIQEAIDLGMVGGGEYSSSFGAAFTRQVQTVCYTDLGYDAINRSIISAPTRARIQDALGIVMAWSGHPTLESIERELASELDASLEYWDDQSFRNYQIGFARVDAGALYEITQISRRGNYP